MDYLDKVVQNAPPPDPYITALFFGHYQAGITHLMTRYCTNQYPDVQSPIPASIQFEMKTVTMKNDDGTISPYKIRFMYVPEHQVNTVDSVTPSLKFQSQDFIIITFNTHNDVTFSYLFDQLKLLASYNVDPKSTLLVATTHNVRELAAAVQPLTQPELQHVTDIVQPSTSNDDRQQPRQNAKKKYNWPAKQLQGENLREFCESENISAFFQINPFLDDLCECGFEELEQYLISAYNKKIGRSSSGKTKSKERNKSCHIM